MPSTLRAASDAIPTPLKPPLLVLMNLILSTAFSYFASPWIYKDVTAIQRPMTSLSDYMGLVGWRIIELMCHWVGGWDATQAASLVMLSLAPTMHYMHTFQPSHSPLIPTLAVVAAGDLLSLYLPLLFLRQSPPNPKSTPTKKENKILDTTRLLTTLLTSTLYQLVLHSTGKKFLVGWLISSGWDIESVVRVHDAPEGVLLARSFLMIPIGWAASEIIFYSPNDATDSAITTYPPVEKNEGPGEEATGVWAYILRLWLKSLSPRGRKIVKRTLLVAAYQGVSATVALAGTVKGGDFKGAMGISGVWTLATVLVGAVLGWVGYV
ncbi:hypothetical protein DFP73DRAFT_474506 [Morchella snyderi]|nr:hypothetical protein DFP73DRAFT_474506 [Morchella snyderi]